MTASHAHRYSADTEAKPVEAAPAPAPALRAVDCKTPEQWAQWARERVEYEDPCGSNRGRKW